MIQVRTQYENCYMKILASDELFDLLLDKVCQIKNRTFNMETGEWMIPRKQIGDVLRIFDNQITWVNPLSDFVKNIPIEDDIISKHLAWENDQQFPMLKLNMYPYQRIGANFLLDKQQAAVFDACGLGKTIQLIGACCKLFEQKKAKRALIVTLSALKKQWSKEIEKFTHETGVSISGTNAQRLKLLSEFEQHNHRFCIVNYEMLRSEEYRSLLLNMNFDVICLDEAQKIKTGVTDKTLRLTPSQNAAAAFAFKHVPYRFMATATPVQGKAEEIFSLFYFLDPNILGEWESFKKHFCKSHPKYGITGYENMTKLYTIISKYFIRRTKEMPEIQQQLPAVSHNHVFLEMDDVQNKVHQSILEDLLDMRDQARSISGYKFMQGKSLSPDEQKTYYDNIIQGLQTICLATCDSPQLLAKSNSNMAKKYIESINMTKYKNAPKLDQLLDLYEQIITEKDSKIVVFSRFERMIDLLSAIIPNSVVYHGQLSETIRQSNVQKFVTDPSIRCFLTTDAGSTGLNLQVANYAVHMDLPFDPTMIEQRNGRIDRSGSAFKNIQIYYYVMSDSYDEHLLSILDRKSDLAKSILDGSKSSSSKQSDVSKLAMEQLLKHKIKNNKI